MLVLERACARDAHVEATLNHPFGLPRLLAHHPDDRTDAHGFLATSEDFLATMALSVELAWFLVVSGSGEATKALVQSHGLKLLGRAMADQNLDGRVAVLAAACAQVACREYGDALQSSLEDIDDVGGVGKLALACAKLCERVVHSDETALLAASSAAHALSALRTRRGRDATVTPLVPAKRDRPLRDRSET